jgi:hypothetical protein
MQTSNRQSTSQSAAQATAQADARAQTSQQIREQVRAEIREATQAARAAADAARQVRVERIEVPTPPTPPTPATLPALPTLGGDQQMVFTTGQDIARDMPPRVQELMMLSLVTLAVIIIGLPIARAIGRWIDRRGNAPAIPTADVQPHLVRIEQAVEAMAIEVERISEAQRYLTKLQTGAHADPLLVPRSHSG